MLMRVEILLKLFLYGEKFLAFASSRHGSYRPVIEQDEPAKQPWCTPCSPYPAAGAPT